MYSGAGNTQFHVHQLELVVTVFYISRPYCPLLGVQDCYDNIHYLLTISRQKLWFVTGNHTFAAVKGTESYSLLLSMNEVLEGINSLLVETCIDVAGKRWELHIVTGDDFKVWMPPYARFLVHVSNNSISQYLLLLMGMNEAHSTYACLWCTIPACDRYMCWHAHIMLTTAWSHWLITSR